MIKLPLFLLTITLDVVVFILLLTLSLILWNVRILEDYYDSVFDNISTQSFTLFPFTVQLWEY